MASLTAASATFAAANGPVARAVARFQVVAVDGSAWLLMVEGGQWWVEARYE